MYYACENKPLLNVLFCRKSASCTHVSAVLHAFNGLKQPLPVQPELPHDDTDGDNPQPSTSVPCTSLPCKWVVPKNRKDSTQQIAKTFFKKHNRDKPVK